MTTEYEGHKTKGHWNVALYIANEEPMYRFAMECIAFGRGWPNDWLIIATKKFCRVYGGTKTPDGFKYTRERVKAALEDLEG